MHRALPWYGPGLQQFTWPLCGVLDSSPWNCVTYFICLGSSILKSKMGRTLLWVNERDAFKAPDKLLVQKIQVPSFSWSFVLLLKKSGIHMKGFLILAQVSPDLPASSATTTPHPNVDECGGADTLCSGLRPHPRGPLSSRMGSACQSVCFVLEAF